MEYRDDDGTVTKVLEWFGFKIHVLVDVRHEVILAWEITSTKTGDNEMVESLVQQAAASLPEDRIPGRPTEIGPETDPDGLPLLPSERKLHPLPSLTGHTSRGRPTTQPALKSACSSPATLP